MIAALPLCLEISWEMLAFPMFPRVDKPMTASNTASTEGQGLTTKKGAEVRYEDLLARVGSARDRAAFAEAFHHFAPRVKSYLLKHGASESTAEEIVQNTFVTVWEKAAGYDPKKAAASTWIFTIARNKRIDALRREKFIEVNTDNPALENAAYQAEEDYADPETVEKLNAAIDRLPDAQGSLLRMAFFDEKSHQAIADETRLPLGTVKSRLRIAMEKLKASMKDEAP